MKIRMTRTVVREYEINESVYPEGYTYEQMAQLDADTDDRDLLFATDLICDEEGFEDIVTWKVVDENGNTVSEGVSNNN